MFNLDSTNNYSFTWQEKLHEVTYKFSRQEHHEQKLAYNHLWLTINYEHTVLKISKPQSILKQPKEIIEKVIEREVKDYISNEVLQQLQ